MSWIQTYIGLKVFPLDFRLDNISILDIAHTLALKCRYGGHCIEFYSVAQHCVLVSHMVPPEDALWGLLHDAGEAYLPDVASPIKHHFSVGSKTFKQVEGDILDLICVKYNLPQRMPDSIKLADLQCLEYERRQLMLPEPEPWDTEAYYTGDTRPLDCWNWQIAERNFLERFVELC